MSEKAEDARGISRSSKLLLLGGSLVLCLVILEAASRLLLPDRYFVWPPNLSATFDAGENIPHGIHFPSKLTINAAGMRGDLPDDSDTYRILAIGGSTTICVYLDDSKAWPFLTQEKTNQGLTDDRVWVGNVGRPGHRTVRHILQADKLLTQHPDIDMLVLLLGINDFLVDLSINQGTLRLPPEDPRRELALAFSVFPGWDDASPWYERNFIGRIRKLRAWRPLPEVGGLRPMDAKGEFVAALRRDRRNAGRILRDLPDLETRIAAYSARVNEIVDIALRHRVRVLLLTQPTLWSEALSPEERMLLWAGGPPLNARSEGADFYSVEALAEGMAGYNGALLEVCRARGVECLDAAALMGHDIELFYDDTHFTERGSAMLADLVSDYLLETPPLARPNGEAQKNP